MDLANTQGAISMISAFLDAGYIVAADDHVGHGKTAMVNNQCH